MTRSKQLRKGGRIVGLHEKIRNVRFRVCRDDKRASRSKNPAEFPTCPSYLKDRQIQEVVLSQKWTANIYVNFEKLQGSFYDVKKVVHGVSFWSPSLEAPMAYDRIRKIQFVNCTGQDCPKDCVGAAAHNAYEQKSNISATSVSKPYWDEQDKSCKAVHPSTIPPRRRWGGFCSCGSTCYTPQAVQFNSSWPWENSSQREKFYSSPTFPDQQMSITSSASDAQKQQRLQEAREKKHCRRELEQKKLSTRYVCPSSTQAVDMDDKRRDESSPKFLARLTCPMHAAGSHHLYFIPKAKLIFCGIPEAGLGEWERFFRYQFGAADYLSLPFSKTDREEYFVPRLPISKAYELWNDPAWTRAVFFRDPTERLLEAHLDKVVQHGYAKYAFHLSQPDISFQNFVELVTSGVVNNFNEHNCSNPKGLHWCTDPHWRPQIFACGIDYLLPHYDFVGSFDHLPEHTELVLRQVGLWDDYGRVYDYGSSELQDQPQKDHIYWKRPPPSWKQHIGRFSNDANDWNHLENKKNSTHASKNLVGFNQRYKASKIGVMYSE